MQGRGTPSGAAMLELGRGGRKAPSVGLDSVTLVVGLLRGSIEVAMGYSSCCCEREAKAREHGRNHFTDNRVTVLEI